MRQRQLARFGGSAAILGAVLALVGNLLHPRAGDDPDVIVYRRFAHSSSLRVADLLLIAALILVVVGFVAIAGSLEISVVDVFSRYGRLAAVVGGSIAVAQVGLESYAYRIQVRAFADVAKGQVVSAFWAANAVDHVSAGLFVTWTLVLLGLAPLFLGVGMIVRQRSHVWVGWFGALGGGVCVVVAGIEFVRNETGGGATDVAFLVGSLLVTVWLAAAGFLLLADTHAMPAESPAVP